MDKEMSKEQIRERKKLLLLEVYYLKTKELTEKLERSLEMLKIDYKWYDVVLGRTEWKK